MCSSRKRKRVEKHKGARRWHLPSSIVLDEHLRPWFVLPRILIGINKERFWPQLTFTPFVLSHSVTVSPVIHNEPFFLVTSLSRKQQIKKANTPIRLKSCFSRLINSFFVPVTAKRNFTYTRTRVLGTFERIISQSRPLKCDWSHKQENVTIINIALY